MAALLRFLPCFPLLAFAAGKSLQERAWVYQGAPAADQHIFTVIDWKGRTLFGAGAGLYAQEAGDTANRLVNRDLSYGRSFLHHGNDLILLDGFTPKEWSRSRDGGLTWKGFALNGGLSGDLRPFIHGSDLFCYRSASTGNKHELYRYREAEDAWRVVTVLPAGPMRAFATFEGSLYAASRDSGVFRSSDDGATWSAALPNSLNKGVGDMIATNEAIWVATQSALYRVMPDGSAWSPAGGGLPTGAVHHLALVEGALLAGKAEGLFQSKDGGATWRAVTALQGRPVLLLEAGEGGTAYVRDGNLDCYVTRDGGDTWNRLHLPQAPRALLDLAAQGGDLVALAKVRGYEDGLGHMMRSRDLGRTWTREGPDSVMGFAVRPDGILALERSGATWLRGPDGIWRPQTALPGLAHCIPESVEGALFTCMHDKVYRFGNPAEGWKDMSRGLLADQDWHWLFRSGNVLYIGGLAPGLTEHCYQSSNGGNSWTPCEESFYEPSHMAGIGRIHFRTSGQRWIQSSDGGVHWTEIDPPMDPDFYAMSLNAIGGTLVAGGWGGHILESTDTGRTWIETAIPQVESDILHAMSLGGELYVYADGPFGGMWRRSEIPLGMVPALRPVPRGAAGFPSVQVLPYGSAMGFRPGLRSGPWRRADGRRIGLPAFPVP